MNKNYILFVGAVIVAFVLGAYAHPVANLGGDFAGGSLPSQLITGSGAGGATGNGYVTPVGSLELVGLNGVGIGGTNIYHSISSYNSATGTPAAVATLGGLGATTSTATTSIALPDTAGLSLGAVCSGGAATTTIDVSGCTLTLTNGVTGTATLAYSNLTSLAVAVPTSTVFRVTFDQIPY